MSNVIDFKFYVGNEGNRCRSEIDKRNFYSFERGAISSFNGTSGQFGWIVRLHDPVELSENVSIKELFLTQDDFNEFMRKFAV